MNKRSLPPELSRSRSLGQRFRQRGHVVGAPVHGPVDEQRRGAPQLTRRNPLSTSRRTRSSTPTPARSRSDAATSSPRPVAYRRRPPSSSALWRRKSVSCMSQNRPATRQLPPRPRRPAHAGGCRSAGSAGRRTGHLGPVLPRRVRSAETPGASTDIRNRLLQEHTGCGRAADVIDLRVNRLQSRLLLLPHRVVHHGVLLFGLAGSEPGGLAAKRTPCSTSTALSAARVCSHPPMASR